jgi:1-acyl-sn-glycerol-3-phosphate acyltransferase
MKYWNTNIPKSAIWPPNFQFVRSDFIYNTRFMLDYTIVSKFISWFAFITRNKKLLQQSKDLEKVVFKADFLNELFKFFTTNEWVFDQTNLLEFENTMFEKEKQIFYYNPQIIDFPVYFHNFCYGLQKWCMKEDIKQPIISHSDITKLETKGLFSDVTFMVGTQSTFSSLQDVSIDEIRKIVLESEPVQKQMKELEKNEKISEKEVLTYANSIIEQMFANPKQPVIRMIGWVFRKIWRRMYEAVIVDTREIELVREISKDKSSGPIILMPTHRSYIDFLIVSYINLAYGLPLPHIAAGEDFLGMAFIRNLFRYSGAFFIRRSFGSDNLYKAIFGEYVQNLLLNGCSIEFFTEGTRSRAGKTLQPKIGLLSIICDIFFKKKIDNFTIIPIHISYEKILEGEGYSRELLGEKKKKETLKNLLQARNVLKRKYGDISVKFSKPISSKEYLEQISYDMSNKNKKTFDPINDESDRKTYVQKLSYKVAYRLNEISIIMPTSLVASIILQHRNGISIDVILHNLKWLKREVKLRNGNIHSNPVKSQDDKDILKNALSLLSDYVKDSKGKLNSQKRDY